MVDPSSSISGGAFLGDRLRVMEHATDTGVFIRSLASRGMIGGLTYAIFGAIHVLETLGCDKILIETVGTGQDEVEIASVADTVLYVTTPSMGDEIQAMKAGAMEIGDIFVVNKADLAGKDKAIADLKAALGLGHSAGQAVKAWEPPVLASSAKSGEGVPELAKELDGHWKHLRGSGEGRVRLKRQHATELQFWIQRRVIKSALDRVTDKILEDMVSRKTDPATLVAGCSIPDEAPSHRRRREEPRRSDRSPREARPQARAPREGPVPAGRSRVCRRAPLDRIDLRHEPRFPSV